jgi:catechol 2,3-dioxygenase-like lactoylglutathione lyase family enzyme
MCPRAFPGSGALSVRFACQIEERIVSLQAHMANHLCFCYDTGMKVLFVAGYGPITTDTKASAAFYRDSLGLAFQEDADGYFHTEELKGVKHFALWPLPQAAQSCFGVNEWPTDLPTPTSWLEFDVEDVAEASEELKAKGYTLLIAARKEPWSQTVTRLLSPEGILVGLTYTPWMRESESEVQ